MDILSLLKSEQEAVLHSLQEPQGADRECPDTLKNLFASMSASIREYMAVDQEFLYLEIEGVLPNASRLSDVGRSHHEKIQSLLDSVLGQIGTRNSDGILVEWAALQQEVLSHVRYQQENIIPRMRELIPTQDREDLAEVLQDLKDEWAQRSPGENPKEQAMV